VAVIIDDIRYTPELSTPTVDWLLGCVQEKIVCQIDFSVSWFNIATADNQFSFVTAGFPNPQEVIHDDEGGFAEFNTGDIVNIINTNAGTNDRTGVTIVKEDDYNIRVVGDTFNQDVEAYAEIIGVTPITAVNYLHNFIENSEAPNYISKVDGVSTMLARVDGADAGSGATQIFAMQGFKSWQIGLIAIHGGGITTYAQKFVLTHFITVQPGYKLGDIPLLQQSPIVLNSLFFGPKCLKHIFKIEALYDYNNPNQKQTGEVTDVLGNTGQYNEKFNNQPTNYSVFSVTHPGGGNEFVNQTADQPFIIVIKNNVDTPFVALFTKLVINFQLAPNAGECNDPTKTIIENLNYDRKLLTLGAAAVNGDNFGGVSQVFKDLTAVFDSTGQITITGKVAFASAVVTKVGANVGKDYILSVYIQDHTLPTATSDIVNLLVEAKAMTSPPYDTGMLSFTDLLIEHNDTALIGLTDKKLSVFPGDELIFKSVVKFNLTARNGNLIDFKKVKIQIYATDLTEEFILEEYVLDCAGIVKIVKAGDPPTNAVTEINVFQTRPLVISSDAPRKTINLQRTPGIDSGDDYFYKFLYPFLFKHQYWEGLLATWGAAATTAFYDVSLPNNGKNNFWERFNSAGFRVNVRTVIEYVANGTPGTATNATPISPWTWDYNSNPDWKSPPYPGTDTTYLKH